jgi:hypothetical protein
MDFSRLRASEAVGAMAGLVLIISLFLEWFTLTHAATRAPQGAWVCGTGNYSCSAWATFPILRWLLIAAALAPLILAYLVVTDAKLSWPAGEVTTIVGLAAITLIGYNGLVAKPKGSSSIQFGVSLSFGYLLAMLAAIALVVAGGSRTLESGGGAGRKPPATY